MTMIDDSNLIAATEDELAELSQLSQSLEQSNDTSHAVKIITPNGQEIELSNALTKLMQQMAQQLSRGEAVNIVPNNKELNSREAAEILFVPHAFFLTLLEKGDIPHVAFGTDYRIRFDDLMTYKKARKAWREKGLEEMARLAQEMGAYD